MNDRSTRRPAPLRAVFLDVGGTIMEPNPSWEDVYTIALEEHGVSVRLEELRDALRDAYRHGGWGFTTGFDPNEETSFRRTVELDQLALDRLGVQRMPESFFRRLGQLFMETSRWHVYPDAYRALTAIRERRLGIGAVSNWVWTLPELLHALDLMQYLDFVAASARIGFEKPHRAIFDWAVAEAGVRPAEALHVGDHLDADVSGALEAGLSAVLLDRTGRYADATATAVPEGVPVIGSLDELIPLIDERLDAERLAEPEEAAS
jgi:REG-2-like HAD superfamily hydrolase